MKTLITEVYVGYNFDQPITDPKEGQKGFAVVGAKWTAVIYKSGEWVIA